MLMNCDALPCTTGGHSCKILGSHSRVAEDLSLLGWDMLSLGWWFLMLQTVPSSYNWSRWPRRWSTVNLQNISNHQSSYKSHKTWIITSYTLCRYNEQLCSMTVKFLQMSTLFSISCSNKWQSDRLLLYLRSVIITLIIQYVTFTGNKISKKHNLTPFHRFYFRPHFYQTEINLLKILKKNTL